MCHQAQHPHHRTAVLIIMSFTAARRSIEPCDRSDRKKSSLIHFSVSSIFLNTAVGIVQMNLTVPHQQKGPALSCFAALSLSLPIATDPSLRGGVTLCDYSNCQVPFVQIEPCLSISVLLISYQLSLFQRGCSLLNLLSPQEALLSYHACDQHCRSMIEIEIAYRHSWNRFLQNFLRLFLLQLTQVAGPTMGRNFQYLAEHIKRYFMSLCCPC